MATSYKEYKISLTNITAVGSTCKDFTIEWEELACGVVVCEEKNGILTIQIPKGCEGECLEGIITCNEPCTNCVPQRVTVCPCNTPADCDDCSSCIDNLCVSVCDDEEFCEDGICKECNDANPCEGDKVCVGGECVCPSGTFETDKGECWPCDPNDVPNCYICTREGLIPVECKDGEVCDPNDGKCKECIGTGDCGDNEVCEDGDCVCEQGFYRDPITGDCIESPDCESDEDCPDCFVCDQFGNCVPKQCPDGQVCDPSDGKCKTPCEDGTDCPNGEGCDPDTGFCEECADQDCSTPDCAKLLGCECDGSDNCVDIDNCTGDCNNSFDCGPGCVCHEGQCVSCKNFPCNGCDVPGCECLNGVDCVEDPDYTCQDEFEVRKSENGCNLLAEATLQDRCSCDPITLTFKATDLVSENSNSKNLDFIIEARKGRADTFAQATQLPRLDNSSHPDIANNDVPVTGSVKFKQTITVSELDVNGNIIPNTSKQEVMFNLNISFNDVGFVNVDNKPVYKRGAEIDIDSVTHRITQVRFEIIQDDAFDFSGRSGCVYEPTNTLGVFSITTSQFNGISATSLSVFNKFRSLFSGSERNPLVKWYRNAPNATSYNESTDVFRKVYVPTIGNGIYVDTLYGPDEIPSVDGVLSPSEGELWSGYGYAARVDCACGDNYDDHGKLSFCQPDEVTADFNSCNTTVQLGSFQVCDVNQDITQWTGVPAKAQVFFDLVINGEVFKIFRHYDAQDAILDVSNTNNSLFKEYSLQNDVLITSVKLVQRTSEVTLCEQVINVPALQERDVEIADIDCGFDDEYVVRVNQDQADVDIDSITGFGLPSGGVFERAFTKGTTASLHITFIDGCTRTINLTPDCCDERSFIFRSVPFAPQTGDVTLELKGSDIQTPTDYVITPPSGAAITGTTSSQGFFNITIPSAKVVDGDWSITFTDSTPNCDPITLEFFLQRGPFVEFSLEVVGGDSEVSEDGVTFSFCEGDSAELYAVVNSAGIGGVLSYTRTNTSLPGNPTTNETITLSSTQTLIEDVDESTSFDFTSITNGGDTTQINQTADGTKVDNPTVSGITASVSNACLGSEVTFTITATPNSTVTVNRGVGEVVTNSSGEGTFTDTPSTVGVKQYNVIAVESAQCDETTVSGVGVSVTVSEGPTVTGSAECENQNPTSDRVLTFEVDDENGTVQAYDADNTGVTLSVTGGNNGDGTSTYNVTVANGSGIDIVRFDFTNQSGCTVQTLQAVPISCSCPSLAVNTTGDTVCVDSGDDLVYEIVDVVVDGVTYSGAQLDVEWRDLSGTVLSSDNPYNLDSTSYPVGNVQLNYTVEINTGVHEGCSTVGSVTGSVIQPQQTSIAVSGFTGSFEGTLCDGGSMEFTSTLESPTSTYSWKVDGVEDGTSRTYTFSEAASVDEYVLTLEVEDGNGCTAEATQNIFVTSCDCTVQYVDIPGAPIAEQLVFTDQQAIDLSGLEFGSFPNGASAITKNDAIVTAIEAGLTAKSDAVGVEVFWQYTGSTESSVRFYILGSNYEFDFLSYNFGGGTSTTEADFTRDCSGTTAPGCTDTGADNYNSDLIGNSNSVTIVDDGSCFNLYETALFATDMVGVDGNEATLDIDINGSVTNATGITQTPDAVTIGAFTYNRRLVDTINGESLDLWAYFPTAQEISNDVANLGDNPGASGCGCTSKLEYVRLYWRYGDDIEVSVDTASCGGQTLRINNDNSATLQKCTGGVGSTVTINAIGKTTTTVLPSTP